MLCTISKYKFPKSGSLVVIILTCPLIGSLSSSTANQRAAQNNYQALGCQDLYFLNFVCTHPFTGREAIYQAQNAVLSLLFQWHWFCIVVLFWECFSLYYRSSQKCVPSIVNIDILFHKQPIMYDLAYFELKKYI